MKLYNWDKLMISLACCLAIQSFIPDFKSLFVYKQILSVAASVGYAWVGIKIWLIKD